MPKIDDGKTPPSDYAGVATKSSTTLTGLAAGNV
jgi:hypothetical protein